MKKTMIIFAVMLLFTYCKRKEEFVQPDGTSIVNQAKKTDYDHFNYNNHNREQTNLELFTLTVNEALKQKKFRLALKQEAIKQFDGDYDVLLNFGKQTNYKGLEQIIFNVLLESSQMNEEEASSYLEELSQTFPKLQLSVPIHCEEWDVNNYIPQVTFIPIGYDDTKDYAIKGFNINGGEVWFNKFEKPNHAVVVISQNERISNSSRNVPPGGGGWRWKWWKWWRWWRWKHLPY